MDRTTRTALTRWKALAGRAAPVVDDDTGRGQFGNLDNTLDQAGWPSRSAGQGQHSADARARGPGGPRECRVQRRVRQHEPSQSLGAMPDPARPAGRRHSGPEPYRPGGTAA